ncbi:hypothetical protein PF005_g30884 [Phytophthora fragariae]|nr:hypothetical protein PF003_g30078 [Phytophthora fragariae]KAE8922087.1 hypothetical protein PF009_g27640 [Phytophthora fragariae]KAE8960785.1 hypothetical protein PF011_g29980 [Phytophthora fragariae]KAE9059745.1 hypothetical protein PF010_g30500 [Phytophthora fragariae]KAE9060571.1 hypothetical protein PF007_g30558 [Phytophthora fragariae]
MPTAWAMLNVHLCRGAEATSDCRQCSAALSLLPLVLRSSRSVRPKAFLICCLRA